MTVLCALYILWLYLLQPRFERSVLQKISEREREKSPLTRAVLLRELWLGRHSPLSFVSQFALVWGALGCWRFFLRPRRPGDTLSSFWKILLFILCPLLVITLPKVVDVTLSVCRGDFKLRRLMASGSRTAQDIKGTPTIYSLGSHMGDRTYETRFRVNVGSRYYVLVTDGEVSAVFPEERYRPDAELRRFLPPEDNGI